MKLRVKYINRKHGKKIYRYPFLGYSYRDPKGTPQFKIVLNLSKIPAKVVKTITDALTPKDPEPPSDEQQLILGDTLSYQGSVSIGDAWAALRIAEDAGITELLRQNVPKKHYQLLVSMIMDRVINPKPWSKLALREALPESGLARLIDYQQQPLHEFYFALESIFKVQQTIEKALFDRTPKKTHLILYDITSAYFEGKCCPLAVFGNDRDHKQGKMIILIGLLADEEGRPIAVNVFEGNTSEQTTVLDQIGNLQSDFGINDIIFVGDRGMLTKARRTELNDEEFERVSYISALPRDEIVQLIEDQSHPMQLSLFDRQNLAEVESDNVRYVLCHNPDKQDEDRETRRCLLDKTEEKLTMVQRNVKAGRWKKQKVIAERLHRWWDRWKMKKFFDVEYDEGVFSFSRNETKIKKWENLDGSYVIASTVEKSLYDTVQIRERYKSLKWVEFAFKSMKTDDLFVRPVRHWNPDRVRGHVFVSMLAYMVLWDARQGLAEFLERKDDNFCEAGSLKGVWNKLNKITIGTIKLHDQTFQQISPLTNLQKRMLKAVNAKLNPEAKKRLKLVG